MEKQIKASDFSFGAVEMTPEEFAAANGPKQGVSFKPGTYDLKVVDAKFMKLSDKDPSWRQYRLILSIEGEKIIVGEQNGKEKIKVVDKKGKEVKFIRSTVMVPTTKETYPSEKPTFMFHKLQEFFLAMGENLINTKESMKAVIPKYFVKPEVLKGLTINTTLGFRGPHLEKTEEGWKILDGKGEPMVPETFSDFDSAKLFASTQEKPIDLKFIEIIKFNPIEVVSENIEDPMTEIEEF